MDELDEVLARLQAMSDDLSMDESRPQGTPLIELPFFVEQHPFAAPARLYLDETTRLNAHLADLPQHPASERCTQGCVNALLETLSIPATPWQQEWLYKLLVEHPRG